MSPRLASTWKNNKMENNAYANVENPRIRRNYMTVSCVSFFPPVLPYGYIITALRAEAVSSRIVGFIFAFTCSFAQIMQRALAVTISQSLTAGEVNVRGKGREERERGGEEGDGILSARDRVYVYREREKEGDGKGGARGRKQKRERAGDCIYSHATYACVTRTCTHNIHVTDPISYYY